MSEKTLNKKIYGSNSTEALVDAETYEPETHVNLPHEEAVETAKQWVDQNEL